MSNQTTRSANLIKLIVISLLGAISLVLFFISFPLPMLPPYLKVDFSDIPAIIAGIIFSPLAGVLVLLVKNGLYFIMTGATDPVGVVANFIAGSVFIAPVAYFYHKLKNVKGILLGLVVGTLAMTIVMGILNYLVILPAYATLLGMEMNPAIKLYTVAIGILPFNIIKGIIVSLLFVPLFIKLADWIQEQHMKLT
ncbi:MAG TPA: ECF transporter S component [Pseudogracilibacillus sp.]|nr:ECF transporter S component [Pseudogracilibacillus sp.]